MRFVLRAAHYIEDRLLEAGTEIGDDTRFPIGDKKAFVPSRQMDPLDKEAERAITDMGLRLDPMGPEVFAAKGDAGKAEHPAESAPGVPWQPWVGVNGPEHGPDLEGNEEIPAGYDTMNATRLQGGGAPTPLADADEAERAPRRTTSRTPNRDAAPADTRGANAGPAPAGDASKLDAKPSTKK